MKHLARVFTLLLVMFLCIGYFNPTLANINSNKGWSLEFNLTENGEKTVTLEDGTLITVSIEDISPSKTRAGLTVTGKKVSVTSGNVTISAKFDSKSFQIDNSYYTEILNVYGETFIGQFVKLEEISSEIVRKKETAFYPANFTVTAKYQNEIVSHITKGMLVEIKNAKVTVKELT